MIKTTAADPINAKNAHFFHLNKYTVNITFATEPKPKPTPTPTSSPKVSIDDAKVQCTDIGFKAGTEKFGDCVLELMQ